MVIDFCCDCDVMENLINIICINMIKVVLVVKFVINIGKRGYVLINIFY